MKARGTPPTVARSPKLQRASAVCGRPPPPLHSPTIAGHQTRGCGAWHRHRHRHQPPQWHLHHPGPGSYMVLHGVLGAVLGAAQGAACCIGCCTVRCWVLHWVLVLHQMLYGVLGAALGAARGAGCCIGCCAGCWVLHWILYRVLGAALGAAAAGGERSRSPSPRLGTTSAAPREPCPAPHVPLTPFQPHTSPQTERGLLGWEGGTGGTPGPARQGP